MAELKRYDIFDGQGGLMAVTGPKGKHANADEAERTIAELREKLEQVSVLLQDAIEGNHMPTMAELNAILGDDDGEGK